MNENTSTSGRFPNSYDHIQYQKSVRARRSPHQDLDSAESVVNYLAVQIQGKYRKGHRHIEAKVGFPLDQIEGLTLKEDGLERDPERYRKKQLERLREIFMPLVERLFDSDHLTGDTTIQLHGTGCTLKSEYRVLTPKQYRQ